MITTSAPLRIKQHNPIAPPVQIALGMMEIGRFTSEEEGVKMTELFLSRGYSHLDTALMYAGGKTQEIMGRFPSSIKQASVVDTKINPWGENKLNRASIQSQIQRCLTSLQITPSLESPPIDILYLHAPDHNTPIIETLEAMNEAHKQGVYRRFGLSNYASWQVAQIHGLCALHSFVLPSVYQGMYNAVTRAVESELIPCLRALNMSFYVYNPLAGGILTGKYKYEEEPTEAGRYAQNDWVAAYKARYWRKDLFDALDKVKKLLEEEGGKVTLTAASLLWLRHHSKLSGKFADCIIIGASKYHHVEENLNMLEGEPLSESVCQAFDEANKACAATCPTYFR